MHNTSDFIIENGVLTRYVGPGGDVTVPAGVTSIGRGAFEGCESLKSVIIPGSVTWIEPDAFRWCKGLERVIIQDGVTNIGNSAFWECTSLTSISIPDSITGIGNNAFWKCESLRCISIPDSVTRIGNGAFWGCKGLVDENGFVVVKTVLYGYFGASASVTIPDSVTGIGTHAFSYCESLADITISDSVTCIGDWAFKGCVSLTSITIPDNVTRIGDGVFDQSALCCLLAPKLPVSILRVCKLMPAATMGFFANRDKFTDESIIKEYEKFATSQKKTLLIEIFRTDLVAGIAFYADAGKITAKNIEEEFLVPAQKANATQCVAYLMDWKNRNISQKSIEPHFEKQLTKTPFNATDMKKLWSFEKLEDGALTITSYKGEDVDIVIPRQIGKRAVTAITAEAFFPMKDGRPGTQARILSKIKSVTIPDSVTSIGNKAFAWCESLTSITILGDITSIGRGAFSWCANLKTLCILGNITNITASVFEQSGLYSIFAPNASVAVLKKAKLMPAAAIGFFTNRDKFTDESIIKEYEKFVNSQQKTLLPEIFKNDLVCGIAFYADAGKITVKNFEEAFLQPAQKANAMQCVAFLSEWKKENIAQKQ